jgi:hypothetical protein
VRETERELLPLQITYTYTFHVCAENSTIALPCENYNETKIHNNTLFGFKIHKNTHQSKKNKRGVWHCGLAIYIKKYLKAKEELWKLKIFHHAKI